MKRSQEDLDYWLYKVYVWGGLPAIVIYIVVTVLVFGTFGGPGSKGFLITIAPLIIWFTGILLYWWWVFLFNGNKELKEMAQEDRVPAVNALKNWNSLHQAMAVSGGSVEEFIKNAKKGNRPVIIWYGTLNLLPIWIFGFIILGSLGIIPASAFKILLIGVFVWIFMMTLGMPFLLGWGSKTAEKAYLAPLGLSLTSIPRLKSDVIGLIGGGQKLIPDGPAIVEGERHGRLVHIKTIDKHSLTVLQSKLPEFKVVSKGGKLTPDENAPEAIVDALKSLRKAKRWQGIEVYSGLEGITIQRESKGTNMWLYDLWLAEYLIEKNSVGST